MHDWIGNNNGIVRPSPQVAATILPIIAEYAEVEACLECSARSLVQAREKNPEILNPNQ